MSLIALYNKVNSIPAVFDYFLVSVQICSEYKWQLMRGKCFYLWFGKHGMLSMLGCFVAAISTLQAAVSL